MPRRFLYYFPNLPGMNPGMLRDRGLLDRFTAPGGGLISHGVTGAVGELAGGCIVAAGIEPPAVPAQWDRGESFWVAIEDLPPRPQDLEREVGLSGYELVLGDGNTWRVPLIHRWNEDRSEHEPNLPTSMGMIGGKVRTRIRPEYQAIDVIASRLFTSFVAEETASLEQAMADAVALLAVNYRIGIEEASLLGLFTGELLVDVLATAIDLPKLRESARRDAVRGLTFVEPVIQEE